MLSPSHARTGFTLVELLVVITVIAILAGMLIPAITAVKAQANREHCAKCQNQIITSCIAYSGDFSAPWPIGETSSIKVDAITTPADAAQITARSFEVLCATMSLPNALFKCRACTTAGPDTMAKADNTTNSWGGQAKRPSYAFDWAAPGDPASVKVMIADRDAKNHHNQVVVAYADAHTKTLKVDLKSAASGNRTDGASAFKVVNPDALGTDDGSDATKPDGIFDDEGDDTPTGANPVYKVGQASARRVILK